MSFSAVCATTSPYDDRKTTKISTTCTYYREISTVRTLRSSRTIEYYVLLSLRTIEKRKDWIWMRFQSGPAFFVRTIENYVLLSVRTIEKWLYFQIFRSTTSQSQRKDQFGFFYIVSHGQVAWSSEISFWRSTYRVLQHSVKETNRSFRCDCDSSSQCLPLRIQHCLFGGLSFSSPDQPCRDLMMCDLAIRVLSVPIRRKQRPSSWSGPEKGRYWCGRNFKNLTRGMWAEKRTFWERKGVNRRRGWKRKRLQAANPKSLFLGFFQTCMNRAAPNHLADETI